MAMDETACGKISYAQMTFRVLTRHYWFYFWVSKGQWSYQHFIVLAKCIWTVSLFWFKNKKHVENNFKTCHFVFLSFFHPLSLKLASVKEEKCSSDRVILKHWRASLNFNLFPWFAAEQQVLKRKMYFYLCKTEQRKQLATFQRLDTSTLKSRFCLQTLCGMCVLITNQFFLKLYVCTNWQVTVIPQKWQT